MRYEIGSLSNVDSVFENETREGSIEGSRRHRCLNRREMCIDIPVMTLRERRVEYRELAHLLRMSWEIEMLFSAQQSSEPDETQSNSFLAAKATGLQRDCFH